MDLELARERRRRYNNSPHGKQMRREYHKKWVSLNPERVRAIHRKHENSPHRKKARSNDPKRRKRCHEWTVAQNDKSATLAKKHRDTWSINDDVWLLQYCDSLKQSELAAHLGRTLYSIRARIYKLKHAT